MQTIPFEFDFKNPDYETVYAHRAKMLNNLRDMDEEELLNVKAYYRDNPSQFLTDWGMTFDPRNVEIGLPAVIPFVLFPKQDEFVDWVYARWTKREDGLAEKSRDMGISWLCVGIAVHIWLFFPGTVVGFGSRKEEYVDKLGDPKSLFWKIRQFINLLPAEFVPEGYVEKKHAPSMRIINPENGATIIGEAGSNIGRGNRASLYFKDESAFYEQPEAIDAALSQTANCKLDLSTVNGNGNPFYKKRHGGKIPVFTFHWRDDPRKDDEWYRKQKERLDDVIVAQEIDIDYNASVADTWIDGAVFELAFNYGPADVQAIGHRIFSIDAAHFGNDKSVLTLRHGRLVPWQEEASGLDGPNLAGLATERLDALGGPGAIDAIVIELDGPGVSCYDQLKRSRYAERVVGIHTGSRVKDGRNYNIRAQAWRRMRDWLNDGPVSLPRDGELKAQACAMKYSYRDGLLLMEDKKEYKKRNGKSPDKADSLMLTFAIENMPTVTPVNVVVPSKKHHWNKQHG